MNLPELLFPKRGEMYFNAISNFEVLSVVILLDISTKWRNVVEYLI